MRYIYSLLLVALFTAGLHSTSYRGFLLTKDNYQLTGYFNLIKYSPTGNYITFTNDFGDDYIIHPMLVKGFGFTEDGQSIRFISRYHEGQWYFLREVEAGRYLRLYGLPTGSDRYVDDSLLRLFSTQPPSFYLAYGEGKMLAVPRSGYKRLLRNFIAPANPNLASRIGKKGYRYRDLVNIVAEYNVTSGRKRRRL